MWIDSLQIYSMIYRSQIDSYSYLPQFPFMALFLFANIVIWRILFLITNIIQSIHEFIILILNIYKEYAYISLWLCLPGRFFKWEIYKSQENKPLRKKLREKICFRYFWIICECTPSDKYYSYSYSQVLEFTNYSYSY